MAPEVNAVDPDVQDLTCLLVKASQVGNLNIVAQFPERFAHGIDDAATLCVVEEAGEFAGAYRRWRGYARRAGTHAEMAEELADVVIASFFAADAYGIDLPSEIRMKLTKVFERGWKEPR